ncbi:DEAD/DEAH box helicase domain-containing protein [Ditylenchus destructor]|uniref:RNA helicase n=1 Tax=Ditylenchus destructor TaxID=166010 RepID=A0AAD4N926_9BILA|nr:DEAD/DEAH box helicase domain-containing protein [Ditylenchus destructor]
MSGILFPCLDNMEDDKSFKEEDTSSEDEPMEAVVFKPDKIREKNKKEIVSASSDNIASSTFGELNLSRPMLKAVFELGFLHPTPIQKACIPVALAGRDMCACSATGTGKTAAFMLPIFERLLFRPKGRRSVTRVLVLVPTRELAIQVFQVSRKLSQFSHVDICLCAGR